MAYVYGDAPVSGYQSYSLSYTRDAGDNGHADFDDLILPVLPYTWDDDISEGHAVDDAPLKKIHSEGSRIINRTSHYFQAPEETPAEENGAEDDVKEYKRPDSNRFSGNRRF